VTGEGVAGVSGAAVSGETGESVSGVAGDRVSEAVGEGVISGVTGEGAGGVDGVSRAGPGGINEAETQAAVIVVVWETAGYPEGMHVQPIAHSKTQCRTMSGPGLSIREWAVDPAFSRNQSQRKRYL